jgi:conjugal transfer pilus assembly protein TraB
MMKQDFPTSWTPNALKEILKEKISGLSPRKKQLVLLIFISLSVFLVFIGIAISLSRNEGSLKGHSREKGLLEPKPQKVRVTDLVTSSQGIDEREIWVNKIQSENEEIRRENEAVKSQNKILEDKIDVLDNIFKKSLKGSERENFFGKETFKGGEGNQVPSPKPTPQYSTQTFPPQNSQGIYSAPSSSSGIPGDEPSYKRRSNRIFHLGSGNFSRTSLKKSDTYLPAGSHAKVALLSGVVAMTAVESQGNPLPIVLRVIDDGNLPRGFKSRIKNAQIIGACYGDISSERVYCRMESMSWVEADGTTVEKKIEGWILGEDGRPGLRGEVVDRSGDVARQAMVAGVLGTMTSFLQMEATRSVYPVSPFGQTNSLSGEDALKGAAAGGVGNALDKLADFAIKRAEQMQPVIVVASGRVADVVFKSGVNVTPYEDLELKMVSGQDSSNQSDMGNG